MEKVFIKNMVCRRCTMSVQAVLENLGINPISVELGEVQLAQTLTPDEKQQLQGALLDLGFELIDDKKSKLIEQVKTLVRELVHNKDSDLKTNLSDYLGKHLQNEYNYVSNLFSEIEGTTVAKYFIAQRIERVKELLVYDELSLSEIAYQLHYSSVAYLSSQFKKVTGLTPSHFKRIKGLKRKPLDQMIK